MLLLVLVIYLVLFRIFDPNETNCLVKRTIGIPCPGCGMSRACYYLLTMQFKTAFVYHPLVFVMPLIMSVLLFSGYGIFNRLYTSKIFWGIILVLFTVVYVIRMYLYFPNTEPMDYHTILEMGRNAL